MIDPEEMRAKRDRDWAWAYALKCPSCGAVVGSACLNMRTGQKRWDGMAGLPPWQPHPPRILAAAAVLQGKPIPEVRKRGSAVAATVEARFEALEKES